MTDHHHPDAAKSEAPTPRQLRTLRGIAFAAGLNYTTPATAEEADAEITRLRDLLDTPPEHELAEPAHQPWPMRMVHTFPTPGGGRHLIVVSIPSGDASADTHVVLDIPVDPEVRDDVRMVGSGYASTGAAWSAATRHATRPMRPAVAQSANAA
jgi:hypothetical protein